MRRPNTSLPFSAWQIDDWVLESLRLCGCHEIRVNEGEQFYDDEQIFNVTEDGILSYCFTMDDNKREPRDRFLAINWSNITPAFFKKVVEVHIYALNQRPKQRF